jgi:hypothetical protein
MRARTGSVPHRRAPEAIYSDTVELQLGTVEPSLAGPTASAGPRLADERQGCLSGGRCRRCKLRRSPQGLPAPCGRTAGCRDSDWRRRAVRRRRRRSRSSRRSTTGPSSSPRSPSCTNTSNPSVMIGAGLVAKKAVERGLRGSRGSRAASHPVESRDRILHARSRRSTSISSGSISLATAARPASATVVRCRTKCRPSSATRISSFVRC